MKISKFYLFLVLSIIIILFSVSALCNQCGLITPATNTTATEEKTDSGQKKESGTKETTSQSTSKKEETSAEEKPADKENKKPVINDIVLSSATIKTGEQYDVTGNASDPDGDSLTYKWTASGGAINNDAANPMKWTAPAAAGSYTITLKITDGKGGEATQTKTVDVQSAVVSLTLPRVTAEGGYVAYGGIPINPGGCLFAGDEPANNWVVGYISFDITGIAHATIQSATMTFNVKKKWDNPSFYASFLVYETYWGEAPISTATYSLPVNQIQHIPSTTDGNFTVSNDALKNALQAAINADHTRFQIGLSPTVAITDGNNDWDGIEYDQSGITLNITYIPGS